MVETLGGRVANVHANLGGRVLLEPAGHEPEQAARNPPPAEFRRDVELLHRASAAVAGREVARDVPDHRPISQRHIPRSGREGPLGMVLAPEVGGHARVRRTGFGIAQAASGHLRHIRVGRCAIHDAVELALRVHRLLCLHRLERVRAAAEGGAHSLVQPVAHSGAWPSDEISGAASGSRFPVLRARSPPRSCSRNDAFRQSSPKLDGASGQPSRLGADTGERLLPSFRLSSLMSPRRTC